MRPRLTVHAFGAALWLAGAGHALASPPTGVFLWYPEQGTPTSQDCDDIVARVGPSLEKAEAWLWGRAPFGSELEFYLFLTKDRMETTFSAEGDYDTGTLRLGPTIGDETTFELVPEDHPTITISGSIVAPKDSSAVTIILRDVPSTNGPADRVAHYCRFDDETEV
ncbi:hypothetical protein D5400_00960 [Georhizobium profundi]|jgi:hypothetical protein|uniref:Uncharacterized protein n=2 Tax=Hyphomicrobiales TaxID=356 RepID=A0A3Q8XKZ2_9HYPH|nr:MULTISPECIES: hypothetical protein [Hyphomicrobiales]AZN70029.1 hypothetical protein D5400_00960 [Georhizobium profundi]MCO6389998.1 hypothetical protein [Aliihoeflea aestuarii]MDF1598999.1 hypothetical protein [Mesorhizobium sp. YIM 152430]TYR29513.1 hypothetical protein FY036_21865 [Mesorhizobium microcysteis]